MYSSPDSPTDELVALISDTLKKNPVEWKKPHTGLTVAQRFVVRFEDGSSHFVKAAMDDLTEECLRIDHLIMTTLKEDFVPEVLAWVEPPGQRPALVIEDLSHAHWPADHNPVLWKCGQFEILFETLKRVATITAPKSLPATANPTSSNWRTIAENLDAFSQLGLCSSTWLEQALPPLIGTRFETAYVDFDRWYPWIIFAKSVGELPNAKSDLTRRSRDTEGSPDSIFATRD